MKNGVRGAVAALLMTIPAVASAAADIAMHRDPGCPCCEKWAQQVKAQFGRAVRVVDDANRPTFMKARGVPQDLASCHTAIIDGPSHTLTRQTLTSISSNHNTGCDCQQHN